ncbi:MAG: hypothetical protein MJ177_05205 [Clostridia bacterium]|nr:hypothetical protein [Clostridia bacterium]
MFYGSYQYNVDAKNRICITTEYRDEHGQDFVCRVSHEPVACVHCMNEKQLDTEHVKFMSKYGNFRSTDKLEMEFYSNVFKIKLDTQGRITLTQEAKNRAKLSDSVYVVGAGTTFKIMSAENYELMNSETDRALSEIDKSADAHFELNVEGFSKASTPVEKLVRDFERSQGIGATAAQDNAPAGYDAAVEALRMLLGGMRGGNGN